MRKENLELIKELRRELHRHAELSNKEVYTKKRLMGFIRQHTKLEVVDEGLWFYAIYRAGDDRRNIAYRADFDAIPMDETIDIPYASINPGVSHKCGHDGHAATLAGFALEIDELGSDKNIFFLFQHAEETGDGAAQCVKFIEENNIDDIYAYHNMGGRPLNSVSVIDGTCHFASKGLIIKMIGKPSHASEPEKGINPAFAIAEIISNIPKWSSCEKSRGLVLCTVIQVDVGEPAFGISASRGDLLLTIRAQYEDELKELQSNIEQFSNELAEKFGLQVNFEYNDIFPMTSNHKENCDRVRKVCRVNGVELLEMKDGYRTSEDFGYFLDKTKGCMFYIGNGIDFPPLHTHEYDFPEEIIETAITVFKGLAEMD